MNIPASAVRTPRGDPEGPRGGGMILSSPMKSRPKAAEQHQEEPWVEGPERPRKMVVMEPTERMVVKAKTVTVDLAKDPSKTTEPGSPPTEPMVKKEPMVPAAAAAAAAAAEPREE